MRILHLVESFSNGGISEYLRCLIPRLTALGLEILLASRAETNTIDDSVRFVQISKAKDAAKYIRDLSPDIVHIHDWPTYYLLKKFYRAKYPKFVIHCHGYSYICPGDNQFLASKLVECTNNLGIHCIPSAYINKCQRSRRPLAVVRRYLECHMNLLSVNRIAAFIANSEYVKYRLVGAGIPNDLVSVIPYFTELSPSDANGLVPGRIFTLGRFTEAKGFELLVDAVASMKTTAPWSLVIGGDGYLGPKIKQRVTQRNLTEKVTFAGWISDERKLRLLQEAHIVVVPSVWPEAFGIVGIEAMACGKPVVAFNVGGVSDWLSDNISGFLIPPNNVDAMRSKIEMLLENPAVADKMGQAGRQVVEHRFRHSGHTNELIQLYESLLA